MTDPLSASTWSLISMGVEGAMQAVFEETMITIQFADGELSGEGGCNSYSGTFTIDGNAISIEMPTTTFMYCESPEGVMQQEKAYLMALVSASSFSLEEGTLRIDYNGGGLLFQLTTESSQ